MLEKRKQLLIGKEYCDILCGDDTFKKLFELFYSVGIKNKIQQTFKQVTKDKMEEI
jgi:hypothetical protein